MTLKFVNNHINLLTSEEQQLQRELKQTPVTEHMTVKGRVRKTVANRLAVCRSELDKLKKEKIRLTTHEGVHQES